MKVVKVGGIVVIVLVLWKMIVLKNGQLMALAFNKYEILDTSRNSVVNLGRVLNTPAGDSVVMEGDNVKEDSLALVNVSFAIVVSVLLRDTSKEPDKFAQP